LVAWGKRGKSGRGLAGLAGLSFLVDLGFTASFLPSKVSGMVSGARSVTTDGFHFRDTGLAGVKMGVNRPDGRKQESH